MPDIRLKLQTDGLLVSWGHEFEHLFHPLWLRESSNDPDFRDVGTGLRIGQASQLPLDVRVIAVEINASGEIDLAFSDGHRCTFEAQALYRSAKQQRPDDLVGEKVHWDGNFGDYPVFSYATLRADDTALIQMLDVVARYGFAYVEGIPGEFDALAEFARRVGPMRETNWGTVTDVRAIPDPYDLTMTARPLSPHVDNPYRLPGPGFIFMHCLRNAGGGGESTLVDGFNVAATLKRDDPEAFAVLTTIAPNFRHSEESAVLEDYGPMIQLNEANEIVRIRYSNRTEQIPALAPSTLTQYYRARKRFAELILSEALTLKVKLRSGDGFIWDNFRILHGRMAFDVQTGDRHMRHCYLDRDTVSSRQKCLIRQLR